MIRGLLDALSGWLGGRARERRAERRQAAQGVASVSWETELGSNDDEIELIDVSPGGVRFRSKYRFARDQALEIDDGQGRHCRAIVRHCQVDGAQFEVGASAEWIEIEDSP